MQTKGSYLLPFPYSVTLIILTMSELSLLIMDGEILCELGV